MATIPAVVPMPRSNKSPRSLRTRATSVIVLCRPEVRNAKTSSATITTTLFTTGANAAATKRLQALSSALARAVKP